MFTSILVPICGTAESNVSLPLARIVARDTGASNTVLRVLPLPEWPLGGSSARVQAVVRSGNVLDQILEQKRQRRVHGSN
jgi:hypothetical protein